MASCTRAERPRRSTGLDNFSTRVVAASGDRECRVGDQIDAEPRSVSSMMAVLIVTLFLSAHGGSGRARVCLGSVFSRRRKGGGQAGLARAVRSSLQHRPSFNYLCYERGTNGPPHCESLPPHLTPLTVLTRSMNRGRDSHRSTSPAWRGQLARQARRPSFMFYLEWGGRARGGQGPRRATCPAGRRQGPGPTRSQATPGKNL